MRLFSRRCTIPSTRQRGVSLIELLVAMLLTIIGILAMMGLFRTTSKTATENKLGTQQDGQIATGLLAANKLLKGAGYKQNPAVLPTYPADIAMFDHAIITANGVGNRGNLLQVVPASTPLGGSAGQGVALLWRNNTASGTFSHQGLYAPGSGGLWRVTGSGMSMNNWRLQQRLLSGPAASHGALASAGITRITLARVSAGCSPFGIGSAVGKYRVTLEAVGVSGSQVLRSSTCLLNFQ